MGNTIPKKKDKAKALITKANVPSALTVNDVIRTDSLWEQLEHEIKYEPHTECLIQDRLPIWPKTQFKFDLGIATKDLATWKALITALNLRYPVEDQTKFQSQLNQLISLVEGLHRHLRSQSPLPEFNFKAIDGLMDPDNLTRLSHFFWPSHLLIKGKTPKAETRRWEQITKLNDPRYPQYKIPNRLFYGIANNYRRTKVEYLGRLQAQRQGETYQAQSLTISGSYQQEDILLTYREIKSLAQFNLTKALSENCPDGDLVNIHEIEFGSMFVGDGKAEDLWSFFLNNHRLLSQVRRVNFAERIQDNPLLESFHQTLGALNLLYTMNNFSSTTYGFSDDPNKCGPNHCDGQCLCGRVRLSTYLKKYTKPGQAQSLTLSFATDKPETQTLNNLQFLSKLRLETICPSKEIKALQFGIMDLNEGQPDDLWTFFINNRKALAKASSALVQAGQCAERASKAFRAFLEAMRR